MKYIQLILAFLGTIFLIGLPYMLAFWGYNFLAGIFTILPKVTFFAILFRCDGYWVYPKSFQTLKEWKIDFYYQSETDFKGCYIEI